MPEFHFMVSLDCSRSNLFAVSKNRRSFSLLLHQQSYFFLAAVVNRDHLWRGPNLGGAHTYCLGFCRLQGLCWCPLISRCLAVVLRSTNLDCSKQTTTVQYSVLQYPGCVQTL